MQPGGKRAARSQIEFSDRLLDLALKVTDRRFNDKSDYTPADMANQ